MSFNKRGKTGIDTHFVICDVCGKKYRVYETVKVRDRYSTQNNLIVCHGDVDKINPQIYPIYLRDDLLANKEFVRPEQAIRYVANPDSDVLPSAPQNLRLEGAPFTDNVYLTWDGSDVYGSSPLIGYNIYCANPQLSTYFIIALVANDSAYIDINSLATSDESSYYVTAVSSLGESAPSNVALWPTSRVSSDVNYLITSDTQYVVSTGSGAYIVL